jgi:hypothetical protein
MRTASLDLELYKPSEYRAWENPKLETLAKNAHDVYMATKAGQVIFCDRVFSGDGSFDIHEKIRKSLVKSGFKPEEITIVNGFTKGGGEKSDNAIEKEVSAAVENFNSGKYKILIGSTACIGEGLNLQENSAALHHFDIPFRPSDFIQRNGRIDRQGNSQKQVELHTYMSAGTIDNYSVALVQRKANWIDKLLKTKSHVFVNPNDDNFIDADELLLALTEEWGDADKAAVRKEEMTRIKEEKILEAQNSQRKDYLAALSMLRGSLTSFEGDKGSMQYQNRIKKITNMEKALKSNPTFTFQRFIDKAIPFLYAKNIDQIIQAGDIYFSNGRPYEIIKLNFKKQEFIAKPLREDKRTYYPQYRNNYNQMECNSLIKVPSLIKEHHLEYFSKLNDFNKKLILEIDNNDFYKNKDEKYKEEHYTLHLKCAANNRDFDPICFYKFADVPKLYIRSSEIAHYDERPGPQLLNPFNKDDLMIIQQGILTGFEFDNEYRKDDDLEAIKECYPSLFPLIQKETLKSIEEVADPSPYYISNIPLKENTAKNFRENVLNLEKNPQYAGNPLAAAKSLIHAASPEARLAIKKELELLGCKDHISTQKVISSWVSPVLDTLLVLPVKKREALIDRRGR